jgi:hypothetical protein
MLSAPRPAFLRRWLLGSALFLACWLASSLLTPESAAQPSAQSQPSPAPRVTATPAPTQTADEQLQELQRRKLNREIRLLDEQFDRVKQEQDIDGQAWRAPAAAVAAFGPTLVGLGFLYLAARALLHWLPRPERRPAAAEAEDDEDDF